MKSISAILLSGGKGSRMQETIPKQYLQLGGKPMIMHTIERLDKISAINEIIIVCEESYMDYLSKMLKEYNISKDTVFVKGGNTRQASVYNGLKKVSNEQVIIHEAARPFVRTKEFINLIEDDNPNITLGYDIPFTVLKGNIEVEGILNRSELINVQLPQKFNTKDLLEAHENAIDSNNAYTEDASLLFYESHKPIKIIKGQNYNIKITEPIDLLFGEIIYKTVITKRM